MPNDGTEQRKLAAIMFTDMVGYSALSQRNEALALELLEEHRALLRPLFTRFNGTEIKTIGDAFLVEFHSALEAAQCGIEIQRALAHRNHDVAAERRIELKIGIHIGDVVHRGGDVYGDGVNIASRIEPLAGAGGICVSMDVERQIRNALEARFEKLGATELKNIAAPMELFRIVLPWEKPSSSRRDEAHEKSDQSLVTSATAGFGWIAVLVVIAAGVGWLVVHQPGKEAKHVTNSQLNAPSPLPTTAASLADQRSVAVLPFANMGADKADEYLSDGISEEIINALSKIKGLKVPARTSCFAFKGKYEDIQKIGQQLRVGTVLEGSISKVGNKLRVTAQLINIADGFHLWSEIYDRALDDLLAIRTEVAAQVVKALKGHLLGEETQQLTKRTTENAEAHRLYLQGRYQWNRRVGEDIKTAIECFNQAIGKDPSYALAYAGLADCYIVLPFYAKLPQRDTFPKARAAALKALELDSTLVESLATLARIKAVFEWDWTEAEAEFRRAIELEPNHATIHQWFADGLLAPLGRFDEAVTEIKRAQQIDPLSAIIQAVLGEILGAAGKENVAIEVLQQQIGLDPSFVPAHAILGISYLNKGKLPEAIAELETVRRLDASGTLALDNLGSAYARAGRTNEAQKFLSQLLEFQRQGNDHRVGIARIQHALAYEEQALGSLEIAAEEHAGGLLEWLNVDPAWKDLRPHPRFQAILKKMNLVK